MKSTIAATIVEGPKKFWEDRRAEEGCHIKLYANFGVSAFCGRRTKVDFKDWEVGHSLSREPLLSLFWTVSP